MPPGFRTAGNLVERARRPLGAPAPGRGDAPAVLAAVELDQEASAGDSAVRCLACAHRCLVRPGRVGICGVRENRDGRLMTLVYGEAVSANADPIEKKPLFHVYPGTVAYSIATPGCNFHCRHCQNWEISQAWREGMSPATRHLPPRTVVALALAAGARSVAYTYVEPTVFIEYVLDTAELAHAAGLTNVLVTNGYQTPEALDLLGPLVDAANVDLKAFSDAFYRKVCGARLAPVLASLVGMRERGIWIEVTTLLIPGANDDRVELRSLARWIARELGTETPWHVSRFFPAYRMLDLPPTPIDSVRAAVEIGHEAGLAHVYAGNVGLGGLDGGDDTYCAGCGERLIRRRGFSVTGIALSGGACPRCGKRLAGIGLRERADRPGREAAPSFAPRTGGGPE